MKHSITPSRSSGPRTAARRTVASKFAFVVVLAVSAAMSFPIHAEAMKDVEEVKEASVTFKSGTVIEIAFASVEGGKEAQLGIEYFPKIMPIAAKYGGRILATFHVTAVTGGDIQPQIVAIFEWPDLKARDRLLADPEATKLFPIRDDALTFIALAYYTVEQDTTVTFREDKTYEFFNGWLTPSAKEALPEYFKQSDAPKQKYGPPKFLVGLKPVETEAKEDFVLRPNISGIVEWTSTGAYLGLIADPEFRKAAPLLEKSVTRLDMVHTKFDFSQ